LPACHAANERTLIQKGKKSRKEWKKEARKFLVKFSTANKGEGIRMDVKGASQKSGVRIQ